MKKSRYTDSQIINILKQAEGGTPVPELCREYGMSSATCYRYQPKLDQENHEIADWLLRLTMRQRNWGFKLCFFTRVM